MERINRDVGDIDDVRVGWLVFLEAWEEVATLEVKFSRVINFVMHLYCETHSVIFVNQLHKYENI